jgi:hypothetical protein
MSQSPFPTPEQLALQKKRSAAATDEVEVLRKLVFQAFATQNPDLFTAYRVDAKGFSQQAVNAVFVELRASRWSPRRGGQRDQPGMIYIDRARPSR